MPYFHLQSVILTLLWSFYLSNIFRVKAVHWLQSRSVIKESRWLANENCFLGPLLLRSVLEVLNKAFCVLRLCQSNRDSVIKYPNPHLILAVMGPIMTGIKQLEQDKASKRQLLYARKSQSAIQMDN